MMQKKNWINKKYGVIGGSLLLLILCFELAFKNSFEAYRINQNLKAQLSQTSELSYQPDYLHQKNKNLNAILDHYHSDSLALRGNTIANISRLAEKGNVKLSEVPVEDPVFHTDQYIIERLKFVGDFKSLVKTLDYWEVSNGMGISRSIAMKTIRSEEPANQKITMEVLLEISK